MKQFFHFFLICFILLIQSITLSAQSRFTYQIKSDIIINGLFDSDPDEQRSTTTLNLVIPGPSFALGGKYGYFLTKKRNLKVSLAHMLEYKTFSRFVSSKYNATTYKTKKRFQSINLSIPLTIDFIKNKWSFSTGVAAAISLRTKVKASYCSYYPFEDCSYDVLYSFTHLFNKESETGFFSLPEYYTDHRLDFQYLLALQRKVNQKFSIGLEYRNYIFENHLYYRFFDYDIISTAQLKRQTNTLSVSLFYKIN